MIVRNAETEYISKRKFSKSNKMPIFLSKKISKYQPSYCESLDDKKDSCDEA